MSLGAPEILVLLFLLVIPVGLVLLVLLLVKLTQRPAPPQIMPPATPEQRLRELDTLKARNLVSDEEYEAKRNEILGGL